MRLAIIGSRNCPPVDIASQLKYIPDTIVSGGARGADTYAREFAKAHNLQLVEYLPCIAFLLLILSSCYKEDEVISDTLTRVSEADTVPSASITVQEDTTWYGVAVITY